MHFSVEKSLFFHNHLFNSCIALLFLCFPAHAWGLSMQAAQQQPAVASSGRETHHKGSAKPGSAAGDPQSQLGAKISGTPSSPVKPASVSLQKGILQVQADGSDLHQILREIADRGGMTIDGMVPSVRVYGRYGPANSRDVLTDLLTGLGYNFMMVGTTQSGVPQKLLLTDRSNQPTSPAAAAPAPAASSSAVAEDDPPGPGAIVNVPPAGPDDPQTRAQQNLQRLQQMHDQQVKPNEPQ